MTAQPQPARQIQGRDIDVTAPARSACYAAWSELTASPHDLDPRPGLRDKSDLWAALPHARGMSEVIGPFKGDPGAGNW